ncbi:MAG: hypothetical protein Q4B78_02940, partial [Bacillota bacterium]|nr:hypothetical protein [Bacillota bacterium]
MRYKDNCGLAPIEVNQSDDVNCEYADWYNIGEYWTHPVLELDAFALVTLCHQVIPAPAKSLV